jgi:hypothetical protein
MKFFFAGVALGLACGLPALAETAVTIKETELKKEPFSDAATLAMLPCKASVEVLKRQGGWTQIKSSSSSQGWVRMLNLRFGDGSEKSSGSGLGALFNVARTGSSGTVVTTGVKGFDVSNGNGEAADGKGLETTTGAKGFDITAEDIQNATPNMAELKRMHGFTASKSDALKFAASAKLAKQNVDYLPAGSSSSSSSSGSGSGGSQANFWGVGN